MATDRTAIPGLVMRFAEILDELGRRLHLGCVMAAGEDWVEVSLPENTTLNSPLVVRFHPLPDMHRVNEAWRGSDRVGLTYVDGGPPEDMFAGSPGLMDRRPAAQRKSSDAAQ